MHVKEATVLRSSDGDAVPMARQAPQYEDEKPPDRVSGLAKQLRRELPLKEDLFGPLW